MVANKNPSMLEINGYNNRCCNQTLGRNQRDYRLGRNKPPSKPSSFLAMQILFL